MHDSELMLKYLEKLDSQNHDLGDRMKELADGLRDFRSEVNHRFEKVDERFAKVDERFERQDAKIQILLDSRSELKLRNTWQLLCMNGVFAGCIALIVTLATQLFIHS